jgi:hypothetical protein
MTDVAGMAQLSLCIWYVDNVEKEGYRVGGFYWLCAC